MGARGALASAIMALYVIGATPTYVLDEETKALCQMLRDNCAEETGVDVGLFDKINAGADLTPDPKLKCYLKCVMETAGMMDGGVVDVDATVELLPDPIRTRCEANVRACGSRAGADDCDTAYLTQECWQKKDKSAYYLV